MPYVVYRDPVYALIQWLYDHHALVHFDRTSRDNIKRLGNARVLSSVGAADVARWLTALVPAERLADGPDRAASRRRHVPGAPRRLVALHIGGDRLRPICDIGEPQVSGPRSMTELGPVVAYE